MQRKISEGVELAILVDRPPVPDTPIKDDVDSPETLVQGLPAYSESIPGPDLEQELLTEPAPWTNLSYFAAAHVFLSDESSSRPAHVWSLVIIYYMCCRRFCFVCKLYQSTGVNHQPALQRWSFGMSSLALSLSLLWNMEFAF